MKYYAAPMEGITGYIYRRTHAKHFGGCDRYYMPFVDPKDHASLMRKEKKDMDPDNNRGIPVVPQILTNKAERFLSLYVLCRDMGYPEVNLNLGCPSGTVVSSGKGSGFLADPDRLRSFFEKIFEKRGPEDIPVSVKTRLGMKDPEEISALMDIFNDYPLGEVIIHARVREDYYRQPVRLEAFGQALSVSRHPVCYNGDLYDEACVRSFRERFPQVDRVMLGRGLIADPGLPARLASGEAGEDRMDYRAVRDFLRELCDEYEKEIGNNALFKMKEIWTYMLPRFDRVPSVGKKLMKSRRLSDYRIHMEAVFREYV